MWLPHALLIQHVVGLTQSEQLHVPHIELASFDLVHDSLQKSQPRSTHIIYYSLGDFHRSYQRGLHSRAPKIYRWGKSQTLRTLTRKLEPGKYVHMEIGFAIVLSNCQVRRTSLYCWK
jgi:hypothetical protein